jgi:hypothetical protein
MKSYLSRSSYPSSLDQQASCKDPCIKKLKDEMAAHLNRLPAQKNRTGKGEPTRRELQVTSTGSSKHGRHGYQRIRESRSREEERKREEEGRRREAAPDKKKKSGAGNLPQCL